MPYAERRAMLGLPPRTRRSPLDRYRSTSVGEDPFDAVRRIQSEQETQEDPEAEDMLFSRFTGGLPEYERRNIARAIPEEGERRPSWMMKLGALLGTAQHGMADTSERLYKGVGKDIEDRYERKSKELGVGSVQDMLREADARTAGITDPKARWAAKRDMLPEFGERLDTASYGVGAAASGAGSFLSRIPGAVAGGIGTSLKGTKTALFGNEKEVWDEISGRRKQLERGVAAWTGPTRKGIRRNAQGVFEETGGDTPWDAISEHMIAGERTALGALFSPITWTLPSYSENLKEVRKVGRTTNPLVTEFLEFFADPLNLVGAGAAMGAMKAGELGRIGQMLEKSGALRYAEIGEKFSYGAGRHWTLRGVKEGAKLGKKGFKEVAPKPYAWIAENYGRGAASVSKMLAARDSAMLVGNAEKFNLAVFGLADRVLGEVKATSELRGAVHSLLQRKVLQASDVPRRLQDKGFEDVTDTAMHQATTPGVQNQATMEKGLGTAERLTPDEATGVAENLQLSTEHATEQKAVERSRLSGWEKAKELSLDMLRIRAERKGRAQEKNAMRLLRKSEARLFSQTGVPNVLHTIATDADALANVIGEAVTPAYRRFLHDAFAIAHSHGGELSELEGFVKHLPIDKFREVVGGIHEAMAIRSLGAKEYELLKNQGGLPISARAVKDPATGKTSYTIERASKEDLEQSWSAGLEAIKAPIMQDPRLDRNGGHLSLKELIDQVGVEHGAKTQIETAIEHFAQSDDLLAIMQERMALNEEMSKLADEQHAITRDPDAALLQDPKFPGQLAAADAQHAKLVARSQKLDQDLARVHGDFVGAFTRADQAATEVLGLRAQGATVAGRPPVVRPGWGEKIHAAQEEMQKITSAPGAKLNPRATAGRIATVQRGLLADLQASHGIPKARATLFAKKITQLERTLNKATSPQEMQAALEAFTQGPLAGLQSAARRAELAPGAMRGKNLVARENLTFAAIDKLLGLGAPPHAGAAPYTAMERLFPPERLSQEAIATRVFGHAGKMLDRFKSTLHDISEGLNLKIVERESLRMEHAMDQSAKASEQFQKLDADIQRLQGAHQALQDRIATFHDKFREKLIDAKLDKNIQKMEKIDEKVGASRDAFQQKMVQLVKSGYMTTSQILEKWGVEEAKNKLGLSEKQSWLPKHRDLWSAHRAIPGTIDEKNAMMKAIFGVDQAYHTDPFYLLKHSQQTTAEIVTRHQMLTQVASLVGVRGTLDHATQKYVAPAEHAGAVPFHQFLRDASLDHVGSADLWKATEDMFVPKEHVAEVRSAMVRMTKASEVTRFIRHWLPVQAWLSKWTLAPFPRFLAGNFWTGAWMNFVHNGMGVTKESLTSYYKAAKFLMPGMADKLMGPIGRAAGTASKLTRQMINDIFDGVLMPMGSTRSTFMAESSGEHFMGQRLKEKATSTGAKELQRPFQKLSEKGKVGQAAAKVLQGADWAATGNLHFANKLDNWHRLASYIHLRENLGLSHIDALKRTNALLWQMDLMGPAERNLAALGFFYSWTRNAVPWAVRQFMDHPETVNYGMKLMQDAGLDMEPDPETPSFLHETPSVRQRQPGGKDMFARNFRFAGEDALKFMDTVGRNPLDPQTLEQLPGRVAEQYGNPLLSYLAGLNYDYQRGMPREDVDTMRSLPGHVEGLIPGVHPQKGKGYSTVESPEALHMVESIPLVGRGMNELQRANQNPLTWAAGQLSYGSSYEIPEERKYGMDLRSMQKAWQGFAGKAVARGWVTRSSKDRTPDMWGLVDDGAKWQAEDPESFQKFLEFRKLRERLEKDRYGAEDKQRGKAMRIRDKAGARPGQAEGWR